MQDLSKVVTLTIDDAHYEITYQLLTMGRGSCDLCPLLEDFNVTFVPCSDSVVDFLLSRLRQTRSFQGTFSLCYEPIYGERRTRIYEHPELMRWRNRCHWGCLISWTNEGRDVDLSGYE